MAINKQHELLVEFLRGELAIPSHSIDLALRHCRQVIDPLPIVLWQYGLVTLEQLEVIFDWQDRQAQTPL